MQPRNTLNTHTYKHSCVGKSVEEARCSQLKVSPTSMQGLLRSLSKLLLGRKDQRPFIFLWSNVHTEEAKSPEPGLTQSHGSFGTRGCKA